MLLITVGDMSWSSVGVHGSETPNLTESIDRLAREGMRFEHAPVTITTLPARPRRVDEGPAPTPKRRVRLRR